MKKIKYLVLAILIPVLYSCSDESNGVIDGEEQSRISTFEDYFTFLNQETDGGVLIQSMSTVNSNGETYSVISNIKGDKSPLTLKVDDRVLSFNDYNYSSTENRSYSNLSNQDLRAVFGNKFEVELTNSDVQARTSNDSQDISSVYIPELVNISFSNLVNGKIGAGTQITWNSDANNTNGVVIGLEYNPLAQLEESIVNEKPDRLLTGVTVDDSGSYIITSSDLSEYPSNSLVTFYVGRAGYNITTDASGNADYSLAAMTATRADLEIEK